MTKTRLEAFSDGVIAIIITIMVLEFHTPEEADWHALASLAPIFLTYVLSFIYIGIYWNNHHYLIHASTRVTAGVLWANLHLLFWLSLTPFVTGWMGHNHLETIPTATYGAVLFMAVRRTGSCSRRSSPPPAPTRAWRSRSAATPRADLGRPLRAGDRLCVRQSVGVGCALRRASR